MFLHAENQQLLWQTLQKSPYLVEFTQKFAGYRDAWFCEISEQFYTQWISENGRVPTNARELLAINKRALQTMVADLKRLLGYTSSSPQIDGLNAEGPNMNPYNVAEERKRREDKHSEDFNQYQSEYNQMLQRPAVPMRGLPSESTDAKIKNMDELLEEQTRLREMDLEKYGTKPQQTKDIKTKDANTISNMPPKLKIMNEIERAEMEIVSFSEDASRVNKSVRWNDNGPIPERGLTK